MSGAKRAPSSSVKNADGNRPPRRDAVLDQRLEHLEAGEHAEVAVEATAGAHRVDVRAGHHRRERRVRAGTGGDDVADRVDRHVEAEVAHPGDDEVAARAVGVGERQAGAAALAVRAVHRADLAERLEALPQPADVDAELRPRCRCGSHRQRPKSNAATSRRPSHDGAHRTLEQLAPRSAVAAVGSPM